MGGKKRSVFDTVEAIEAEDTLENKKQRKTRRRDVARSLAAKKQDAIYRRALECRILLQRPLSQAQGLGKDSEEKEQAMDLCNDILATLLEARQTLSRSSDDKDYRSVVEDDLKLEQTLQNEYEYIKEESKNVLDKRHKELRLHLGHNSKTSFRVMDSSFWEQVTSTAEHELVQKKQNFDDSKVYQLMLKEFVASKTSDDEGSKLPQRAQNVKKQGVDRKASKGRKIRYHVSPKLVNFTFPLSRPQADLDVDAYFGSLFGSVARKMKA